MRIDVNIEAEFKPTTADAPARIRVSIANPDMCIPHHNQSIVLAAVEIDRANALRLAYRLGELAQNLRED